MRLSVGLSAANAGRLVQDNSVTVKFVDDKGKRCDRSRPESSSGVKELQTVVVSGELQKRRTAASLPVAEENVSEEMMSTARRLTTIGGPPAAPAQCGGAPPRRIWSRYVVPIGLLLGLVGGHRLGEQRRFAPLASGDDCPRDFFGTAGASRSAPLVQGGRLGRAAADGRSW